MAISQEEFFDEEFNAMFPEVGADVSQTARGLFPAQGLTPEQADELSRLTAREQRLSPMEAPRSIRSTRIGGNPFSTDISPAVNAIQQGLTRMINAEQQRRLIGDPEEYQEAQDAAGQARGQAEAVTREGSANVGGMNLQYATGAEGAGERAEELGRRAEDFEQQARDAEPVSQRLSVLEGIQESGQAAQENQAEIIKEMFPDLAGRLTELEKQKQTEAQEHENQMERIREQTRQDIREWEQTEGTRPDGGSGSGGRDPQHSVGVVTGFIDQTDPYINGLTSTIQKLEEQRIIADDKEQVDDRISDLKAERAEMQRWKSDAYRALAEGNLYDPELIQRFNAITGAGQVGADENTGRTFIDEMNRQAGEQGFDFDNPLSRENRGNGRVTTGAFD